MELERDIKMNIEYKKNQEKKRIKEEPNPSILNSEEYTNIIKELKRISVEFDEIEKPNAYTEERCDKMWEDAKKVGKDLYNLGNSWDIKRFCIINERYFIISDGDDLLRFTMDFYVSPYLSGHRNFWDKVFDGLGNWLC